MAVWSSIKSGEYDIVGRFDADFFHPKILNFEKKIKHCNIESLSHHFDISDGNHLKISNSFIDRDEGIPYFRGQDLNGFFLENASPTRIPPSVFMNSNMQRSHFAAGDVLICIVGASTGTISIVSESILPATGSCKIGILRKRDSGSIDAYVLAAFLMGTYGQYQIARNTRGTAQTGIILKDMFRIRIPIFDDANQKNINLLLKTSILANREGKRKYSEAQQILESELGLDNLNFLKPTGYTVQFSELECSRRTDSQHYQPQFVQLLKHLARFDLKQIRSIRTFNRRGLQPVYIDDGKVDVVNSQHLGLKHIDYNRLQKTSEKAFTSSSEAHIQKDDLLIYTTGAYIGRTNVFLNSKPALASNHVNILRLNSDIDAAYMALVFQSVVGQFQTQKHARGSAQAELYPADIDKFVVPIIAPSKQAAIGNLVRNSLEKQQESQRLLEQAKTRVEQLIEEAAKR
jgi:type I restriction enzyme, S subunit